MVKKIKHKDQFAEREAQKYEHPIPSREFILDLLTEKGQPVTYRQLIEELKLEGEEQKEALRRRLLAMARDGQLHQNRRGAYGPIGKLELIAGRVIGHKDGFGFVVPDEGGDDLFLNGRQMRSVFHGDRVLVRVAGLDNRNRPEGVIVEVLERNTKEIVGRLVSQDHVTFIEPTNQRISQEILIPEDCLNNAQHGQMVVVEVTEQPTFHNRPLGKVVEILGEHMAPGMEIDVAIRNHGLPYEWSAEVLKEVEDYTTEVAEDALKGRKDLRALAFVTIDGEDAKDFDDAVYCVKTPAGGWTLYVAIADVSYYVKPRTALDEEALNRGNSVYFPERVIPMLPEVLSNGLCSLRPDVNRLTMVCEMSISPTGKITDYHFYEAVIKSHARLTYNKVYAMVEQNDADLQAEYRTLLPDIQQLFALYRVLYKAREKRGTIDFDLPETKIVFGSNRKIERIVPLVRNDAHRLIEECMLCANICAARFLLKNECPGLYRVHEGPNQIKLNDLRRFLGEMALSLPGGEDPTPKDYAQLLSSVADRPDVHLIQTVLLRSLSQARYSSENKGHFGLAYDAYAHFTSPIRRYPDLLVHRAIRKVLQRQYKAGEVDPHLETLGEHCSMTERRADDATREAVDWLKCEFMLDKVGEEFPAIIAGVTSFGFFVELVDIYVEGLVHISTLPGDYYHFDAMHHELSGERSGRRFRLGDAVRVLVARVDLDERQIDFVLVENEGDELTQKKTKKKSKVKSKMKSKKK